MDLEAVEDGLKALKAELKAYLWEVELKMIWPVIADFAKASGFINASSNAEALTWLRSAKEGYAKAFYPERTLSDNEKTAAYLDMMIDALPVEYLDAMVENPLNNGEAVLERLAKSVGYIGDLTGYSDYLLDSISVP